MCHHFRGSRNPPAHLADEFSVRTNHYQLLLPDQDFFPLAKPPIIRLDDAGEREMTAAEWGLLPRWWRPSDRVTKRSAFQRKCFNARSEEADVKPSYRDAFRRRRCLLPASEFHERGHWFHLAEFRTFALAGLWERWEGAEGEMVESCTMLTTAANALVAEIGHPRMPVMLTSPEDCALWLDAEIQVRGPLERLFTPLESGALCRYAAGERTLFD